MEKIGWVELYILQRDYKLDNEEMLSIYKSNPEYMKDLKLPEAIPKITRDYGKGVTIDFIKHFFNITDEAFEGVMK